MKKYSLSNFSNTIFVCGTDTDVGKTYVTGKLIQALNQQGIRAGGFKPVESGCQLKGKKLIPTDALHLKTMGNMPEDLSIINPYSFKEPLAPGIAAKRVGKKISFAKIEKNLRVLQKKYDILFVEGAGGLLVPITQNKTNLDLIHYLNIPVLIIARLGLGTINHTLLTVVHLKKNSIPILGVFLNATTSEKSLATQTNPKILEKLLKKEGVPLLGVVGYAKNLSRA